jgi:surface antigen
MNNKEIKTLLSRNIFLGLAMSAMVFAASAQPAKAWNCVQFVHQVSSFKISGDAWQWWNAAFGRYDRGRSPARNAVLVFDHTRRMIHGHVAVVANLIGERMIEIDHANWSIGRYGRGQIARHVRVQDVSEKNDWSLIEVWNEVDQCWGHPYKALGFIYAR